jgi:hypothetical protein
MNVRYLTTFLFLTSVTSSLHLRNQNVLIKKSKFTNLNTTTSQQVIRSKSFKSGNRILINVLRKIINFNRLNAQQEEALVRAALIINKIGNIYGIVFSSLVLDTIRLSNEIKNTRNQINRLINQNASSRQINANVDLLNQLKRTLIRKIILGSSEIVGRSLQFAGKRGLLAGAITSVVTFIIDRSWDYADVFRDLSK